MHVTNGIPLGCPLFLPVHTVNCVQTLKADPSGSTEVLIGFAARRASHETSFVQRAADEFGITCLTVYTVDADADTDTETIKILSLSFVHEQES
jgi:CO/xanthine dehydrogenase Mo-binding subunit